VSRGRNRLSISLFDYLHENGARRRRNSHSRLPAALFHRRATKRPAAGGSAHPARGASARDRAAPRRGRASLPRDRPAPRPRDVHRPDLLRGPRRRSPASTARELPRNLPLVWAAHERCSRAPERTRLLRRLLTQAPAQMEREGHRRCGTRVVRADRRGTHGRRLVARSRTRRPRRRAAVRRGARALAERGAIGPALRVLPGRHTARRTQAPASGPAKALDRRADRCRHPELGGDRGSPTDPHGLVPCRPRAPGRQHRLPRHRPVAAGARQGRCAEPAPLKEVDASEENPALDMKCGRTASLARLANHTKAAASSMPRQTTPCRP
jgi:hypothetical protein